MIVFATAMWAALAGGADNPAIKEYPGGWSLYKNADNCALMRSYDKDTTLHVAYYAGRGSTRVSVIDSALKDIMGGAKLSYKLVFMKGEALDEGWGSVNATGLTLGNGEHGLTFATSGTTFLDDMTKNELFGLMNGDDVVESLKLDQASEPVAGLKQCALTIAGK